MDLEFNPKYSAGAGPQNNVTVIQQKPTGSYQKQRTTKSNNPSAGAKPMAGIAVSGQPAINQEKP